MTDDQPIDRGRGVVTDGCRATVTKTARADAVVTREADGDEVEMLRVPISSTRPDRENDRFDKEALDGMADQVRSEQPHVFDNHGLAGGWMDAIPYDSREVIGSQMDAEVVEADDGEHDLFAFVNPDGSHPEGERMLKQVRDEKQPIKFSVGFGILDSDPIEDEAGNEVGRVFQNADLMETSRVGIPANSDASVSMSAAKSGGAVAPGFQMHPVFRAMFQQSGHDPAEGTILPAAKTADGGDPDATGLETPEGHKSRRADGGTPDDEFDESDLSAEIDYLLRTLRSERETLRSQVDELRSEVAELRDDDGDECSVDTDCPEGEVCLEGECVPEDDVDDDDSASTDPDDTDDADLRERIAELEESLEKGRGEPDSADTDTTEEPDLTSDADPDGDHDAEPDEQATSRTATELARGN